MQKTTCKYFSTVLKKHISNAGKIWNMEGLGDDKKDLFVI